MEQFTFQARRPEELKEPGSNTDKNQNSNNFSPIKSSSINIPKISKKLKYFDSGKKPDSTIPIIQKNDIFDPTPDFETNDSPVTAPTKPLFKPFNPIPNFYKNTSPPQTLFPDNPLFHKPSSDENQESRYRIFRRLQEIENEKANLIAEFNQLFPTEKIPAIIIKPPSKPNSESDANANKELHEEYEDPEIFQITAQHLFLTYANTSGSKQELLKLLKQIWEPVFIVIGQELHINAHTHFHGYINFGAQRAIGCSALFTYNNTIPHIETCVSPDAVINYCKKSGDFLEWRKNIKGHAGSPITSMDEICRRVLEGESLENMVFDQPKLLLNYIKIKKNANSLKLNTEGITGNHWKRKCLWIYGETGIGKSFWCRTHFPISQIYSKPQNEWWNGYTGQLVVILDDFDDPALVHYLKIWSDCYAFACEIKGDVIAPTYRIFIVTSNRLPRMLFTKPEDLKPIMRRFKVMTINDNHELVKYQEF